MTNPTRRTFLSVAGLLLAAPGLSCGGDSDGAGTPGSGGAGGGSGAGGKAGGASGAAGKAGGAGAGAGAGTAGASGQAGSAGSGGSSAGSGGSSAGAGGSSAGSAGSSAGSGGSQAGQGGSSAGSGGSQAGQGGSSAGSGGSQAGQGGSGGAGGQGGGAPFKVPAWLDGVPLNTLVAIPGTEGAGGSPVDAYSGFALKADTSELFCLCCGGHSDSYDNRVTSINLLDDAPTWVLRHAPSAKADVIENVPYYADGLPGSRHTYRHNFWMPELNRLMMIGCRATYPGAHHLFTVDGFNPDTNTWDPAGTWPLVLDKGSFGQVRDGKGRIWTNSFQLFDPATKSWSKPDLIHPKDVSVRTPMSYDPTFDQIFCLQWGDGFGYAPLQVNASRLVMGQTTHEVVTFSAASSAAYDQFEKDQPTYGGMDFDLIVGKFLFYSRNNPSPQGKFYWIRPDSGTVWDMETVTFAGAALPDILGGGINGKFAYVPALRGFVLMPAASSGLFFVRTG